MGPPSFCNAALLKRVEKVSNYLKKLPDLQDSQSETTLLRHCLSFPKILFSLRTCPPEFIKQATDTFDAQIRDTLADIVGGPLPEWSWRKASLPCSLGGLGLRNAHEKSADVVGISAGAFLDPGQEICPSSVPRVPEMSLNHSLPWECDNWSTWLSKYVWFVSQILSPLAKKQSRKGNMGHVPCKLSEDPLYWRPRRVEVTVKLQKLYCDINCSHDRA